jgi:CheY-like chemotaxis protein
VNLVGNAVKFTERGGVEVRVRAPECGAGKTRLRFEVADTGVGIAPEFQGQLFERYFRGDPATSRSQGGTGLGLAISRELVRAMGGEIGLESTPGQGSTFWFEVPAPLAGTVAESAEPGTVQPAPPDAPLEGEVLLVEDNPVNQRIAERMLEKAGFEVTVAASGMEALALVERREFAAIFMDCQMPVMDGYQTTEAIRRLERATRRVPIIAMTASAMKGERERCLAAGMDDYVAKPVDPAELRRVTCKWVGTTAAGTSAAYQATKK